MAMGPRTEQALSEGWEWTKDGMQAWNEEMAKFDTALFDVLKAKTIARSSRSLDGSDCREAGRFIMTNFPPPKWVRWVRIGTNLFYVLGGVAITTAFTTEQSKEMFVLLLVLGGLFVLGVGAFQEIVLRK